MTKLFENIINGVDCSQIYGKPVRLPKSIETRSLPIVEYWIGKIMLELDGICTFPYHNIVEDLKDTVFLDKFNEDIDDLQNLVKQKYSLILEECGDSCDCRNGPQKDAPISRDAAAELGWLITDFGSDNWYDKLEQYFLTGNNPEIFAQAIRELMRKFNKDDFWGENSVAARYKNCLRSLDLPGLPPFPKLLAWYEKLRESFVSGNYYSGKFSANLDFLKLCYHLTEDETKILGLLILCRADPRLLNALNCFDYSIGKKKMVLEVLGELLDISKEKLDEIFREKKSIAFVHFSIDTEDCCRSEFQQYFDFAFPCVPEFFIHSELSFQWFVNETMKKETCSALSLDNFAYLPEIQEIVLPYLKSVRTNARKGVNILLYGPAGTGKTELSKVLASETGYELYSPKENGFEQKGSKRFELWKQANVFLQNNPQSAILIDEGDDFFNADVEVVGRSNKYFINTELENNPRPTIWTANSLENMDASMIRRFHLIVEVSNPPEDYLRSLAREKFGQFMSDKGIDLIAKTEDLSPAVIAQTAEIARNMATTGANIPEKYLTKVISDILAAQGFRKIVQKTERESVYDPALTNADCNLEGVIAGLKRSGSGRLCLYGPAGSGKTAFGKYVANKLGKTILVKKASDLLDPYVGNTEKRIAQAFEEAARRQAVLLIDEADSFLTTRSMAYRTWEITSVNEFLTQMENYDGIFIATTNFMDVLDEASMRRFDLKAKFDFVTSGQAKKLLALYAKEADIAVSQADFEAVAQMDQLTPGDFNAAIRRLIFATTQDAASLISALEEQVKTKKVSKGRKIGFSA